jgi:NAD+ kinase
VVPAAEQPLSTVGILTNPYIEAAAPLARQVAKALAKSEIEVWHSQELDDKAVAEAVAKSDLLITLGGDGTILHAARLAAGHKATILGINLGRMGFLTEAEPTSWRRVLPKVLRGNYWIEERMMLETKARRGRRIIARGNALNDVVVGQGRLARVVRLEARIDGDLLTNYVADALIVSTPTGSTAYALAAGGPIMPPQQRNILLVPVAPHLSLDRAVVLAEKAKVDIIVHGHSPATLTVDGQKLAELVAGDTVQVASSALVARFARVRERDYFYRTLMDRLVPKDQTSSTEKDK